MSVWHPIVERVEEFSLDQIWVVSGLHNNSDINTIEAGWQVYPELYFDYQPRFFILWANDAYNRTKCYNLRCGGFIQPSRTILIEGAISPTLTVRGPQTELTIELWKIREFLLFCFIIYLNFNI
ncbi:Protein neprosin [Cardamine amara subsp. amara]|uniref:Protein neprosin n=1 Tax=Cardamine amara subsp. amara TaxID=228776 RepID=A0ABD0ZSJ2_CARAN